MRKKLKKTVVLLLAVCLCLGLFAIEAGAEQYSQAQRWNVMLVIDGSDSLKHKPGTNKPGTDAEGLRFEAVSEFLDILPLQGNYAGAIVFTGNMSNNTDEASMLTAIKEDTWADGPVPLQGNLETLKGQIRYCNTSNVKKTYRAETDIGTALLLAQQRCREATAQNGLPSAIFLFTDGALACEYNNVTEQALKNMDKAIDAIRADGTILSGIFLNGNEDATTGSWLRDKIVAANGISAQYADSYFAEITKIEDIRPAKKMFCRLLGIDIIVEPFNPGFNTTAEFTFRIPGVGVEEVSYTVETVDMSPLPWGTKVTITQPDGTEINTEKICLSSARDCYRVYKIQYPMSGIWKIRIELPKDNEVMVTYAPVLSVYINSDFETDVTESGLHANMTANVTAYLIDNGARVAYGSAYNEFDCTLVMQNLDTGVEQAYTITPDANGTLSIPLSLDMYGMYSVYVKFACDAVETTSSPHTWDLTNHTPMAAAKNIESTYGFLGKNTAELSLIGIASDAEDGSNLALRLTGANGCDLSAVTVNPGMTLHFDNRGVGSGEIRYTVTDSQGAEASGVIYVTMKDVTLRNILLIAGAAVLLILAVLVFLNTRARLDGTVTFAFKVPYQQGEKNISAILYAPGENRVKAKTTLYAYWKTDIGNHSYPERATEQTKGLLAGFKRAEIPEENARKLMSERLKKYEKQLKSIKLQATRIKKKGRNETEKQTVLTVKMGRGTYNLYDESKALSVASDFTVTIGYVPKVKSRRR